MHKHHTWKSAQQAAHVAMEIPKHGCNILREGPKQLCPMLEAPHGLVDTPKGAYALLPAAATIDLQGSGQQALMLSMPICRETGCTTVQTGSCSASSLSVSNACPHTADLSSSPPSMQRWHSSPTRLLWVPEQGTPDHLALHHRFPNTDLDAADPIMVLHNVVGCPHDDSHRPQVSAAEGTRFGEVHLWRLPVASLRDEDISTQGSRVAPRGCAAQHCGRTAVCDLQRRGSQLHMLCGGNSWVATKAEQPGDTWHAAMGQSPSEVSRA